jgi:hypothetical protein
MLGRTSMQAVRGCTCLADSTGIKFLGKSECKTKRHGAEHRRQCRKVHLGIDVDTLQIRSIAVTTNEVGNSPMAGELLGQIPSHEAVTSFTRDGAYDTQDVHEASQRRGGPPSMSPAKEQGCAKNWHSLTQMKQSRRAGNWDEQSGNAGAAITADYWLRRR